MLTKAYPWLGMMALTSALAGCHNARQPCPCPSPCQGNNPTFVVRESTIPVSPRMEESTSQKVAPPLARVMIPNPARILAPVAAPAHGGPHPGTIIGLVEMSAEEAKSIGVWPGKTPGAIFVEPPSSTTKMMTVASKPVVENNETIIPIPPPKEVLAPTPPKPLKCVAPFLPSKKDPPSWLPPKDVPPNRVPEKQSSVAPAPQKEEFKVRFWSWLENKRKPQGNPEGTSPMGN